MLSITGWCVDLHRTERRGTQGLACEGGLLASQHRHQNFQILAHVAGRFVERHTEDSLDHHLVGQADTEGEASAAGGLHRQGLGPQHHRVPGVGRDHGSAEVDRRHLAGHGGKGGQRVVAEDLGRPRRLDPSVSQTGHLSDHVVERLLGIEHHADAHGYLVSRRSRSMGRPQEWSGPTSSQPYR
jgi:hypothetical protein